MSASVLQQYRIALHQHESRVKRKACKRMRIQTGQNRELTSLGGLGAHEALLRATGWARQLAPLLDK